MKKTLLCHLALALALTFAATPAHADGTPAVDRKAIETCTAELGIPMPPAQMSRECEQFLALLFQVATACNPDKGLSPEERVEAISKATQRGTFFEFSGSVEALKKSKDPQDWYALRDRMTSQAEGNPGAYLALFAYIRACGEAVPADMRTDEYLRGLVEKSAEGGDVSGRIASAYNHTWGFYGTPVDEAAVVKNLLPVVLSDGLQRDSDVFPIVLANVGMLCRKGADKLPLRIAAFSLASGYHRRKEEVMPANSAYAFAKAVLAWADDEEHAFGGIASLFVHETVLKKVEPAPELYLIAAECMERMGEAYSAVRLRSMAEENGAESGRDYQVPQKPAYTGKTFGSILACYLSQEERDYLAVALPAVKKYCTENGSGELQLDLLKPILDYGAGMHDYSDEGHFKATEQLYRHLAGTPEGDYKLYCLYKHGGGKSEFGKDEAKAARYLKKACAGGCEEAIVDRARETLAANPEPTQGMLQELSELMNGEAAYLMYRFAKAYPDRFTASSMINAQQYALAAGSVYAWEEMADKYSGADTDLETRLFIHSLLVAGGMSLAEDSLAFDDALAEYGAAHPESAGLVKLIRLSLLDFAMYAPLAGDQADEPYVPAFHKDASPVATRTETARRIEELVKDDMTPDQFAELHRRLQIDIEEAK